MQNEMQLQSDNSTQIKRGANRLHYAQKISGGENIVACFQKLLSFYINITIL